MPFYIPLHNMSARAGEVESRDSVAAKVGGLAEAILVEATESTDPSLQRSAAEMNAFAACIGSDSYALNLVRSLCRAMAETSSAPRCGPLFSAMAVQMSVAEYPVVHNPWGQLEDLCCIWMNAQRQQTRPHVLETESRLNYDKLCTGELRWL